jgi:hypothetical protein
MLLADFDLLIQISKSLRFLFIFDLSWFLSSYLHDCPRSLATMVACTSSLEIVTKATVLNPESLRTKSLRFCYCFDRISPHFKSQTPTWTQEHRKLSYCMICSVSAKFATFPWKSLPLIWNLVPALSVLLREIRIKSNVFPFTLHVFISITFYIRNKNSISFSVNKQMKRKEKLRFASQIVRN